MRTAVAFIALLAVMLLGIGFALNHVTSAAPAPNEQIAGQNLPPLIGKNDRYSFEQDQVPVPGPNQVWLQGMEYRPAILTVPVGTTVTWTNVDFTPHDVESYTELFFWSVAQGCSYNYTFTEPGNYSYHCGCNPGMDGMVIVQ